jgi:GNAT superfamily N-acetyltransferase
MDLIVDPSCRRRGAGGALLDFLIMQARLGNATSLQARPYGDQPDALALLDARGFRETMRMVGLELGDVRSAAVGPLADARRALDGRELRITTLAAELASHPGSWARLRGVHQAAQFGWPDPDPRPDGRPHEPETVEEFRTRCEANGVVRDACFIATAGDRFVGYSMLTTTDPGGVQAGSGGTAVRPEYRGLGVATALKACCVAWARDTGVRRMVTSSGNPMMIRVNEKLGFRRTYTEVRLVKQFPAEAAVGAEDR